MRFRRVVCFLGYILDKPEVRLPGGGHDVGVGHRVRDRYVPIQAYHN